MAENDEIKKADEKAEPEKLKQALDESSRHNHGLYIFFLLFLSYVLITVAATTDLQLLIPDSKVKLPLLNVELPLFGFYIVAPLFIIVFHFNMLFNLVQHSRKLYKWDESTEDKENLHLHPFLFNQVVLYKKENINHYFLKTILWLTIYFFPLVNLLLIQLKFSAYHSLPMTLLHSVAFMADCLLLIIYWHRITRPELSVEEYDNFKNILRFHRDKGLLHPAVKTLQGIKGFFISLFTARFFVHLIKFPVYIWRAVKTCFHPTEISIYLRQALSGLTAFSLWIFILVSLLNFSLLIAIKSIHEDSRLFTPLVMYRKLIPHLELIEKTLVASPPGDEIISQYMAMGKTEQDAWIDKAKGLNLQGRDLRFANFYRSNLMKADLRKAQLQGAVLYRVALQGADLGEAELQGASLLEAQLQGADLLLAQLQGASLLEAQLQGADLLGAQLQGAVLKLAELQGANLKWAELQGADLLGAQLQGTNLWKAKLQGANLKWAQLQGADLEEANLQGASLGNAQFRCVRLLETNLQGVLFDNIDTQTDINWDELSEFIRPPIPQTPEPLHSFMAGQDGFMAHMKKAKERCAKFKKEDFPVIQSDFDTFMKTRKELVCKDFYSAEGILRQEIEYQEQEFAYKGTDVGKALYAHMKSSCPDILQKIKDRGKVDFSRFEK